MECKLELADGVTDDFTDVEREAANKWISDCEDKINQELEHVMVDYLCSGTVIMKPTECKHGELLEGCCNACADSGQDPRRGHYIGLDRGKEDAELD